VGSAHPTTPSSGFITVLKLFCPHCYKNVTLPESAAGTDAPCPSCGKAFPIPAKYVPAVDAAPVSVPAPPPPPPTIPTAETPALPTGYTHSRGFTISPSVVAWVPAIALTVVFLLTFFPWVELPSRGPSVYTQGAWRSINGRPTRDFQFEDMVLKDLPPPSLYDRTPADWYIMLPYLLVLLAAMAIAWADRLDAAAVERLIPTLWPHRHVLQAGLALAAFLLLSIEAARGFGLERALNSAVSEKFAGQREKAGNLPGEQKKIDYQESQELAKYGMERTTAFCLAMGLHLLVPLAMLVRIGLNRRGNKPPPRIAIHY
jgi:hypothetical protein